MKTIKKTLAATFAFLVCSTVYMAPSLSQNETNRVVEDQELNLKFELQRCQRKLKIVTCSFILTKQEEITGLFRRRGFYIFADDGGVSRAFTPDGEEYSAKLVQASQNKGMSIVVRPLKGVPLRFNLVFELPEQVRSLSALAVSFKLEADIASRKEVVFRGIQILSSNR